MYIIALFEVDVHCNHRSVSSWDTVGHVCNFIKV